MCLCPECGFTEVTLPLSNLPSPRWKTSIPHQITLTLLYLRKLNHSIPDARKLLPWTYYLMTGFRAPTLVSPKILLFSHKKGSFTVTQQERMSPLNALNLLIIIYPTDLFLRKAKVGGLDGKTSQHQDEMNKTSVVSSPGSHHWEQLQS